MKGRMRFALAVSLVSLVSLVSTLSVRVGAQEPPKPPPPPYSLPWQLRPVLVPNVVRWDNTFAFYEDVASRKATTWATILNAIVRIPHTGGPNAGLGVLVRLPLVYDAPPVGPNGAAITNPLVGAVYGVKLPGPFKLNAFGGFTVPIGMGGGDAPNAAEKNARVKGVNARGHIDSALYNVNDFGLLGGAGFAWIDHGFTAQVEVTFAQFFRVRGTADQIEEAKTSFITGLHVGYFVIPQLSVGGDLRYQRWFNAPLAVDRDPSGDSVDNLTFALGVRAHITLSKTMRLRPGIAYSRALDKPLASSTPNYHMLQIDVPFFF